MSQRAEVTVKAGDSATESGDIVAGCVGRFDAIVVLGGDGMVHLALQSIAGTDTPLGIIAAGTGNDCANFLGLPDDPVQAVDAALDALDATMVDPDGTRRVSLGRTSAGRWWFTVLCAGFDSATNERANAMRWPRGPRRYDLAIVAEMLHLRSWPFVISIDDRELVMPATLVAVGNAPGYGGGKLITPHANLNEPTLGVTVVGPVSRLTLARLAPTLPRAGHIGHPAVSTYVGTTVRLYAPGVVAYADGERVDALPVTTSCVAGALRVLAPRITA